ncbi:hypothetical protein AB6A40_006116 [Gnathostoma spinigerum]|uniref:Uncharacterized protein n=1 Tax=Gnathostoma spinigerum TaxID=75299 RepID=A0ABD6EJM1_9BILA
MQLTNNVNECRARYFNGIHKVYQSISKRCGKPAMSSVHNHANLTESSSRTMKFEYRLSYSPNICQIMDYCKLFTIWEAHRGRELLEEISERGREALGKLQKRSGEALTLNMIPSQLPKSAVRGGE